MPIVLLRAVVRDHFEIRSGLDCSHAYGEDTVVTLTATPDLLHLFVGWSGDCSGILIPTCLVTMSSARSVSATFL